MAIDFKTDIIAAYLAPHIYSQRKMLYFTQTSIMKHQAPSVYFLHISKTAGSSLAPLIRSAYPQELVLPVYEIPDLLKLNRSQINKFKCFTGHFGTGLLSLLDRDISSVTMLRDPFERAISSIHFAKKIASSSALPGLSNELKQMTLDREMGESAKDSQPKVDEFQQLLIQGNLSEIVHHPFLSKMIENIQTLYLGYDLNLNNSLNISGSPITGNSQPTTNVEVFFVQKLLSGLDMNKIVDNAKKRLDTMSVVGIVEQFNDSGRLICDFLNIPIPKDFLQENVSPKKLSLGGATYRESGEIPDEVIRRIDELTADDREIYEYGKTLFYRQLQNKKKKFFFF